MTLGTSLAAAQPGSASTVVAAWDFSQSGGVVQDLQGDDDLSLQGHWAVVAGDDSDPTAIEFAAAPASAATSIPVGQQFNPGSGAFALTVRFRVTRPVTSGSPNVAQHGSFNDRGQIKMQLKSGGRVGCRIKGTSKAYLFYQPTATVNDLRWHTATCARDTTGTQLSVTVDDASFSPAGSEHAGSIVASGAMRFAQKEASTSRSDQLVGDIAYASFSLG